MLLCELCVFLILCRIGTISAELINDNNANSYVELDDGGISNILDNNLDYRDDENIAGIPNTDYPTYRIIPHTSFSCRGRNRWGYYADKEAGCQVFHICQNQYSKISFLCPIGSVFNQRHLICDWWYNFDCEPEIQLFEEETRPNGYTPKPLSSESPEDPSFIAASSDLSVSVVSPIARGVERGRRGDGLRGQQQKQQQPQHTASEKSEINGNKNIDITTTKPLRPQRRNSKRININKINTNKTSTNSSNNITKGPPQR